MSEPFDPYYRWLGIPLKEQPPHHYRLLGIELFESDRHVIDSVASRHMSYLQDITDGPHVKEAQQLLNELSAARRCLLEPQRKAAYDAELKTRLAAQSKPPKAASPPASANPRLSKGVRCVRPAHIYRFWELSAWILPPETRRRVFEPAFEDLKQEHSKARKKYRGKWQRRWLWFCFNLNSLRLFPQCWRCWVWAKIAVLLKLAAGLLGLG